VMKGGNESIGAGSNHPARKNTPRTMVASRVRVVRIAITRRGWGGQSCPSRESRCGASEIQQDATPASVHRCHPEPSTRSNVPGPRPVRVHRREPAEVSRRPAPATCRRAARDPARSIERPSGRPCAALGTLADVDGRNSKAAQADPGLDVSPRRKSHASSPPAAPGSQGPSRCACGGRVRERRPQR
jgi:hypothetical protein